MRQGLVRSLESRQKITLLDAVITIEPVTWASVGELATAGGEIRSGSNTIASGMLLGVRPSTTSFDPSGDKAIMPKVPVAVAGKLMGDCHCSVTGSRTSTSVGFSA